MSDLRAGKNVPTVDEMRRALHEQGIGCKPNVVHCRATHRGHATRLVGSLLAAASPSPKPLDREKLRTALDAAIDDVVAYDATPPEYPGLVLVPRSDLARLRRVRRAMKVASHRPHDQAGGLAEGFPVCSVCGAIQTAARLSMPCVEDGSHSDDLTHAAEYRNRTGRHAAGMPPEDENR